MLDCKCGEYEIEVPFFADRVECPLCGRTYFLDWDCIVTDDGDERCFWLIEKEEPYAEKE